ncbi:sigma-54-dependent transcriptional regulator [Geomesophilobacter sediminis]|uniref:Sigma-54-dependent Fis family transcriptional regulator n=1 Tax=Geomesophilobacter sediminis TaxID=2798584 RepID=A0A8J7IPI4_9BACT|nr:sigma-54 dependent transcriptional regulator [Geomesophilobacter sediminis]MBJ6725478.1 sigma-54-dependent Fis family transcriptional regulator [Geomesophilobacter sediminis]
MNKNRVLVVDDEKLISWSLAAMLKKEGYEVETAGSGSEAVQKFEVFKPELVMLDICLPDSNGLDLLKRFKAGNDDLYVIMITAYSNADSAVQALQSGAEDFFGKPFNVDAVKHVVNKAFEKRRLKKEVEFFRGELRRKSEEDKLVGNSPKMIEVFKMIKVCADADAKTVLITGESGTGKELVAKAIHYHSARADAPFIEVNCAAIPENLLENELFGHEKGAYTDASKRHKGVFEMADGGSVFLDEIGDMPFAMQAKILKVIETKRFRRLGGEEDVAANVRVITATHQNLPGMVRDGKFRGDLFFRLNVMNICLPPLRERKEDIEALVQYFIETLNEEYGRNIRGASPETMQHLLSYDWPGNVRELRNNIERLMMLEPEKILTAEFLSPEIRQAALPLAPAPSGKETEPVGIPFSGEHIYLPPTGISLEELEKLLIQLALRKSGGNQTRAARFLKTSRDTLRYRMKKFGLSDPGKEESEKDEPDAKAPKARWA